MVLGCGCDQDQEEYYTKDYYEEDFTLVSNRESDLSSAVSAESEVLNTPYTRVTPLFRNIEKENWEGVLGFLTTGRWSTSSIFLNMNEHMRAPSPEVQVKTWVTSYDRKGAAEWSQLPLHAAISYSAPFVVIQKLVEMYPKGVQCTDNEGMLPIHLAFGFGAADNVLSFLVERFPAAVNEKGLGGRFPYECCELGPNKQRGKVYKIVLEQITKRVMTEIDRDWRDFAVAAQDSINLSTKQDVSNLTLHEFLLALLKDRKELQEIKKRGAPSPANQTTINTPNRAGTPPIRSGGAPGRPMTTPPPVPRGMQPSSAPPPPQQQQQHYMPTPTTSSGREGPPAEPPPSPVVINAGGQQYAHYSQPPSSAGMLTSSHPPPPLSTILSPTGPTTIIHGVATPSSKTHHSRKQPTTPSRSLPPSSAVSVLSDGTAGTKTRRKDRLRNMFGLRGSTSNARK